MKPTNEQLDKLERLSKLRHGGGWAEFASSMDRLFPDLLRAARVLAAMERWPMLVHGRAVMRLRDGLWAVDVVTLDGRFKGEYPTLADAVLAAAEWLEKQEDGKK